LHDTQWRVRVWRSVDHIQQEHDRDQESTLRLLAEAAINTPSPGAGRARLSVVD
jgi:hypothetical protein